MPSAQEELRALVGGVAEALALLGRTVHELESRVAALEAAREFYGKRAVVVDRAPGMAEVVDAALLAEPTAAHTREEDTTVEMPWSGARRRRKMAMACTFLLLLGSCGLIAALVGSYMSS